MAVIVASCHKLRIRLHPSTETNSDIESNIGYKVPYCCINLHDNLNLSLLSQTTSPPQDIFGVVSSTLLPMDYALDLF